MLGSFVGNSRVTSATFPRDTARSSQGSRYLRLCAQCYVHGFP